MSGLVGNSNSWFSHVQAHLFGSRSGEYVPVCASIMLKSLLEYVAQHYKNLPMH